MQAYYIGLMSGTSVDAIDVVVADFSAESPIIAALSVPFPQDCRTQIHQLIEAPNASLAQLATLDARLGSCFADAVQEILLIANLKPSHIHAIGSHGQTIWHQPETEYPSSWQLGDPNVIAARTGITTVADWRRKDIALGGQGAPLTPAFHAEYFYDANESRAVLNIGGISNLTVLVPGQRIALLGFDLGPGNTLLDAWIRRHHSRPFDTDGQWARQGRVDEALLSLLLADSYFTRTPPKSTGREYFHLNWLDRYLEGRDYLSEDVQATLLQLTVRSINEALNRYVSSHSEVILCGGGARNIYMVSELSEQNPQYHFATSEKHGIASEWLEATAFAWFAKQTMTKQALDLRAITGSSVPAVMGGIYLGA